MDAEDSPTAGLRNGLRSAVGFVSASRMILTQSRSSECVSCTDALDEVPPSHFVSSAPNAERFDPRRTARRFHALRSRAKDVDLLVVIPVVIPVVLSRRFAGTLNDFRPLQFRIDFSDAFQFERELPVVAVVKDEGHCCPFG